MFAIYLYKDLMHVTTENISSEARALVGYKIHDHQHVKEYDLVQINRVSKLENASNCDVPGQLIFKLKEGTLICIKTTM